MLIVVQVVLADEQELSQEAVRFRDAATAAAQATAKEIPQGGGTAASPALQAASKIQPNLSGGAQRPMFVRTQPETLEERQVRRGVQPQPTSQDQEAVPEVGIFTSLDCLLLCLQVKSLLTGSLLSSSSLQGNSLYLLDWLHHRENFHCIDFCVKIT